MSELDTMGFTEMAMKTSHMDDAPVYDPESDRKLMIRFHNEPVQDMEKSKIAGRPIFREVPHLSIMKPGSRDNVIREVRVTDKVRFSKQWEQFEKGLDAVLEGTPLEAWPGITRSQVEELKFMQVYTVENLIDMADVHSGNIMGYAMLKRKAKAFLDAASGTAPIEAMSSEIEELKASNTELSNKLAEVIKKLEDGDVGNTEISDGE